MLTCKSFRINLNCLFFLLLSVELKLCMVVWNVSVSKVQEVFYRNSNLVINDIKVVNIVQFVCDQVTLISKYLFGRQSKREVESQEDRHTHTELSAGSILPVVKQELSVGLPSGWQTLNFLLCSRAQVSRKLELGRELGLEYRHCDVSGEYPSQHLNCEAKHCSKITVFQHLFILLVRFWHRWYC